MLCCVETGEEPPTAACDQSPSPLPASTLQFQQLCRRVDAFLIDWLPSYCGRTTGCSLINVVLVVN